MSLPLSGTNIKLFGNIPWKSDYKNTRYFINTTAQQSWFNSRTPIVTLSQTNYQVIEGKWSLVVDRHIDSLWKVNYMSFQNSQYNNKFFYCFVTKLEYVAKNRTRIHFELDVYQTWFLDTTFKPSYVEREHCPQYASNGLPVVNTIEEGLDYGSMYDTVSVEQYEIFEGVFFLVIACKEAVHHYPNIDLNTVSPIHNGIVQPLTFYVLPILRDGSTPPVTISGESAYIDHARTVLRHLYQHEDMVNNIVSLYITKNTGLQVTGDRNGLNFNSLQVEQVTLGDPLGIQPDGSVNPSPKGFYVKNVSTYMYNAVGNYNKPKYEGFRPVNESKLLMYPYALTVIDDFKGNRIEIKNEYINGSNLEIQSQGSLGVSNKTSYFPLNYNIHENHRQALMEYALIDNQPNDVPIITDMLSAYLQGNRNSIENQKSTIQFNGAMQQVSGGIGLIGSVLSKDVSGIANNVTGMISGAGNTLLQLQGIQAKQQDINNIPPNIAKQGSNTYFDYGNFIDGVFVIKKQIKPEYQQILEDYFKRYGYKVNRMKVPNIRTRQNWNFIKTIDSELAGTLPQEDLLRLQKVFDDGITLWHTDDIGNYNLTNEVI